VTENNSQDEAIKTVMKLRFEDLDHGLINEVVTKGGFTVELAV